MGRRARLHVPGGYYYVSQRCRPEEQLFLTMEDYEKFSGFLGSRLKELRMRVHAYCWLPNEFHLLVEIERFPVGELVRRLANYLTYRKYKSRSAPTLFPQRYRAVLIDPDEYLLTAIRVIHWQSIDASLKGKLNGYQWSSHLAYLGVAEVPWLTTNRGLAKFSPHMELARTAYAEFSQTSPSAGDLKIFEDHSRRDPRVLGGIAFTRRVGITVKRPASTSLQSLAASVARRMGLELQHVLSRSQRGDLPLARAVIAWHAVEIGIAKQTEVARYFKCTRGSLHTVIKNNLAAHPKMFDLKKLPDIAPILPDPVVASMLSKSLHTAAENIGAEAESEAAIEIEPMVALKTDSLQLVHKAMNTKHYA